ncbi:Uncharacterized protein K02A2.6 [Eumeta japonica]|uniref:Uncharacterized protein K02A2.6 n=1 Tax=Eumeta variegata TaxID=151549 RepID=A0A4C1ZMF1_EUMVA|nr:Uncharacterized protein K02A2.6 [Eumeta japonica]
MSLGLFGGSLSFDHHSHDWEAFKVRLTQFCVANGVTDENDKNQRRRRAFLITALTEDTMRVASSLVAPDSLDAVPYERLVSLFDAHFMIKRSVFAERYNFYRAEQRPGEDVAEWAARVRTLARYCNFQSELDIMLRDRFILGLQDEGKERLFTEDAGKITFVAAMELVQSVQRQPVDKVRHWRARRAAGGGARSTSRRAVKYFQCSVFRVWECESQCKECRFANYKCNKCEKGAFATQGRRETPGLPTIWRRSSREMLKLQLKPDAKPIFFKPRPVPFALKPKVDEALDKLIETGILKSVNYSDYATPITPVLKSDGTVRVCGDYSVTLNKVLHIDRYPLPRIEELFARLHEGKEFSKLDLSMAYMQLELTEDSQPLTCINTHRGLFQFTRLVFGLSSAPAIFQKTMERILAGIEGICIFLDDILISGPNKDTHRKRLNEVLNRLQEAGLTLQKEKCVFFQKSIEYLGFVIDKDGLHTSPEKVKAIKEAEPPKNVSQLKSFLGLVNYYRSFVPRMSTILGPLHDLLKMGAKWMWSEAHQSAFETVKRALESELALAHYDPRLSTVLTVDASPTGLGAVLAQQQEDGSESDSVRFSGAPQVNVFIHKYKEATAIILVLKVPPIFVWQGRSICSQNRS